MSTGPEPGGTSESPDRPVTTLRGASVDVDPRRALRLVVAVCLVALTLVAVVLLVAGANKNSQSVSLHDHGVPVSVTVTGCLGLLGGSGSNGAGYACKGSYTFNGHRYVQAIPGTTLLHPGDVIPGVIVPDRPRAALDTCRGRRPAGLVAGVHRTGDPVGHRRGRPRGPAGAETAPGRGNAGKPIDRSAGQERVAPT